MKQRVWKLALLLCAVLLLICSVTVFAAAEETEEPEEITTVASGTCGTDLTWVLTSDGVLTIDGTGAMSNYGYASKANGVRYSYIDENGNDVFYYATSGSLNSGGLAPWYSYRTQITSAVIGRRVTRIGSCAFYDCSKMTAVTIPDSVKTIGSYAFSGSGLTGDLAIPRGVTSIEYGAFNNCIGLNGSLTFKNNLTTIHPYAFYGCKNLTGDLIIPNSVNSIRYSAFSGCTGLKGTLTLGSGLKYIGDSAFRNTGFTGVLIIPNGVTAIGSYAFQGCDGFAGSLTIPGSVQTIGSYAFEDCYGFDGDLTFEEGVKTIGDYAFYYCDGFMGELSLPSTLTSLGDYAFYYCNGFTGDLVLPDSLTNINDYVFSGCYGFTGLTLGNAVKTIEPHAFEYCDGVEGIVELPATLTRVDDNAFTACSGITGFRFAGNAPTVDAAAASTASFNPSVMLYADPNNTGWGSGSTWNGYKLTLQCSHKNAEVSYVNVKTGTHAVVLTCACGEILPEISEACIDENADNVCDRCTAEMPAPIVTFAVAGANMTLGNDLKLNFLIKKSDVQEGFTAKVSQAGAEPVEVELTSYNTTYYAAAYSVAAKEMTDVLSIEIYDAEGNLVSEPFTRTVKQYAMTLMSSATSTESLKRVVVDMLNYGTEAQKYFGHNEDAYANADLTAEQQARYATGDVEMTNNQQAGVNFVGANLSLEDSILLNVFFKRSSAEGMTAKISYTDYKGNEVEADAEVTKYSTTLIRVVVDQIVLADAKCPVTVTVYKNGAKYGSGVESVESYIARNIDNADTGALNMAIMKFATSAYDHLGGTN